MHFKKIQTKVFCAMLITSLIPVGIISAILFFMIKQTIDTEVSVSTNRTAVDIQEKVEEYCNYSALYQDNTNKGAKHPPEALWN